MAPEEALNEITQFNSDILILIITFLETRARNNLPL